MPIPAGLRAVDLMLQIPSDDFRSKYEFLKPLLLDKESREQFEFPAQYMFKDIPTTRRSDDYVGIGGDRVAQTERPADAQHSAAGVVHIERLFQGQRGRGTAEGEIGDADEKGEIGSVDEDLRESGVAAGGALAKCVVRRKAILAWAAKPTLGTVSAGAPTGTWQY